MRAVLFLLAVCFGASAFAQSGQTVCINGKCYRIGDNLANAFRVTSPVVSERVVTEVPAQTRGLARSAPTTLPYHALGLMTMLARVTGTDAVIRCDGDASRIDFAKADVVLLRSSPPALVKLIPRLAKLRRGARVVSYGIDIPDQCTTRHSADGHTLFLWTVGDEEPAVSEVPSWLRGS